MITPLETSRGESVGTLQGMLTCFEKIVPGCISVVLTGSHSTGKDLFICTFWCMCLQDWATSGKDNPM